MYTTLAEIVAAIVANRDGAEGLNAILAELTPLQRCQLDLYGSQGGFRGTGEPSI